MILLLWVLVAGRAYGQSMGANISGIVTDETGARLEDATVTVAHRSNGRVFTFNTTRAGEYRVVALLPGDYEVTAARTGFSAVTRHIDLPVGSDATVNLTLPLAGIVEHATVSAVTSAPEIAQSQPSSIVTKQDVATLPLLDRNFLVLAQLLPGSGPINGSVTRLATTKFGGVADQRSGYTTLIDGGDINDTVWGSPTINVGEEAVQEFKVFRNQFDAQYGHALNAVVTVITRSGTNEFAGTGFYYGRDDALNARYAFASEDVPFDERRIGGSVGGPLVRDRSHYFASYEGDAVNTVRVIALPPANPFAANENGVFPAASDNHMVTARIDHQLRTRHYISARFASDRQKSLRAGAGAVSDSSQVDIVNRSHSVVVEDTWSATQNVATALRVHVLNHRLGTFPRDVGLAIRRPSVTRGLTNADAWVVPITRVTLSDALYLHTPRSDFKIGGELALASHDQDSHVYENGFFEFQTDAPFDRGNRATWPTAYNQQIPVTVTYRSREIGLFAQSDWRIGNRIRLNAGVRYDIDLNLRLNDFYGRALDDPRFQGLDQFIHRDRGTDTNNLQPRLGATWDTRGNGTLIVRGGWGIYVTRNRPWFQIRSMNQFASSAVRVTDMTRLGNFPDTRAVLGGLGLDDYLASAGGRQLGTVIGDDFVQPYAMNTTIGAAWQLNSSTTMDVDYVHSYGNHQTGSTDRNLPASGPVVGPNALPRPVPNFSQVTLLENFTESWYDALEMQLRSQTGSRGSWRASYTLSRSYLDGVDFFLTMRGTQRTPHERGYNPSDQRHNLTLSGSIALPWSLQASGILKLISGSPVKVQAGTDLDMDGSPIGDLPAGIPTTVGRDRVDESLVEINAFRASRGLAPIDASLLKMDPYRTLDVRLTKSLRIGQNHRIDILLEGFNLTNHVNFRPPFGNPPGAGVPMNAPSFLIRTAARDARQIQWGVRYSF
jgi:hypothetical protein